MIHYQKYSFILTALVVAFCQSVRAESRPSPHLAPPSAPKSEFVVRFDYGKDPFFPKSSRLQAQVRDTDLEESRSNVPDFIVVKGIAITKERKFAIINNHTVGAGEEFNLRRGGKVIRVQCVEINDRAVIVSVDGATKAIPLKVN